MTVEGILRKSGKLRVVREIMHALDTSGGNDTVIDLAALCVKRLTHCGGSDPSPGVRGVELTDRLWSCSHSDPVTLADLFKQFLGALPDPLMTSHLFKLFIACSRASSRSHCVCLSTRGVRRLILAFFFSFDGGSRYLACWHPETVHAPRRLHDAQDGESLPLPSRPRVQNAQFLPPCHNTQNRDVLEVVFLFLQ